MTRTLCFVGVLLLFGGKDGAAEYTKNLLLVSDAKEYVIKLAPTDFENHQCQTDDECRALLPNLEDALSKVSTVPSAPLCSEDVSVNASRNSSSYKTCTCGDGKCVSYTMDVMKGKTLYYCGPCSHIGAKCQSTSICAHDMAECRDDYCVCKNSGQFYEFSYCDIPYVGYEVALQTAIIVCIVIAMFLLLASVYSAIDVRKLRTLTERSRQSPTQEEVIQSTFEDSPPVYEDVADNLPSYQDAIEMNSSGEHLQRVSTTVGGEEPTSDDGGQNRIQGLNDNTTAECGTLSENSEPSEQHNEVQETAHYPEALPKSSNTNLSEDSAPEVGQRDPEHGISEVHDDEGTISHSDNSHVDSLPEISPTGGDNTEAVHPEARCSPSVSLHSFQESNENHMETHL